MPVCCDGVSYGKVNIVENSKLVMSSLTDKQIFTLALDNASLCVVPISNRDDMELHFNEREDVRDEDCLVQLTLHFPPVDPVDDADQEQVSTHAETTRETIMGSGIIKSVTGDIIAEFSKDQGNFVTPRGKYAIAMTSTYMHMQGSQYSYKIKYTDISALYLLPKLDGGREAFVIALEKPIRQGNQKHQYLVLETHKIEHTMNINLTEEEIKTNYDGQLTPVMTMPTSHLIAKVFKILSATPVSDEYHELITV